LKEATDNIALLMALRWIYQIMVLRSTLGNEIICKFINHLGQFANLLFSFGPPKELFDLVEKIIESLLKK
jgi:hypothetical protein